MNNTCPPPLALMDRIGMVLFVAWLFFLGFIARVVFSPLLPSIEESLGLSHAEAGGLFFMVAAGFFCGQMGAGFINSRLQHRGALIVSAAAVGAALLPFVLVARSLAGIRLLMFLVGIAAGIHVPSAIATITASVQRSDWGKALGIHQTAPNLSFVMAPMLAELFMRKYDWSVLPTTIGVVSLVSAILFARLGKGGEFYGSSPRPEIVGELLRNRSYWAMILLFCLGIGGGIGVYAMLPLFLIKEAGMTSVMANTLLGLSRVSGLVMPFASGLIMDRIGEKRAIGYVLAAGGAATLVLGLVKGPWLIAALFVQPAILTCFFPPAFSALSRIVPPHMRTVATSLTVPAAFMMGVGVVPWLLGYAAEIHSFSLGIALLGICIMTGSAVVAFLRFRVDQEEGC
ncbi:MAG: MFS transporter [Desulfatiglandales bacterium]